DQRTVGEDPHRRAISCTRGSAYGRHAANCRLLEGTAPAYLPRMSVRVAVVTNQGNFEIELDEERAPKSVANFRSDGDAKHYDGTIFHRVIPGFMVQGGGYDARYDKKPVSAAVENEAQNGLKNKRGTVAMARTSEPHSATAQFFVNVADNAFL